MYACTYIIMYNISNSIYVDRIYLILYSSFSYSLLYLYIVLCEQMDIFCDINGHFSIPKMISSLLKEGAKKVWFLVATKVRGSGLGVATKENIVFFLPFLKLYLEKPCVTDISRPFFFFFFKISTRI